jgi:hypothetical protein
MPTEVNAFAIETTSLKVPVAASCLDDNKFVIGCRGGVASGVLTRSTRKVRAVWSTEQHQFPELTQVPLILSLPKDCGVCQCANGLLEPLLSRFWCPSMSACQCGASCLRSAITCRRLSAYGLTSNKRRLMNGAPASQSRR